MQKTQIKTYKKLDKWLSENNYFEDGHVLSINQNPLEITIGYNIKGDYKANSERHIQSFKITPSKIIEWTYKIEEVNLGDENYIVEIIPIKNNNGICLEFSTPSLFKLTSDMITIEEQETIITTFRPWVSETEIFLTSELDEIPNPEFWRDKLKEFGHEIVYRVYGGKAMQIELVPYPDYEGYFMQYADNIVSTEKGIFIRHISLKNNELNLHFEKHDKDLNVLWKDLTVILADFPNARIGCGNCEFTGEQWNQYLSDKSLSDK